MNVAVIGSGGREHAIIKKLKESKEIKRLYALPGNGGIARDAQCINVKATDLNGLVRFCREHQVDFAVVAPDDPLYLGAVDRLHEAGVKCFGPDRKAAQIEGSKVFSKGLMKKYSIPTARYEVFDDAATALDHVQFAPLPLVVKADGLALGKGVSVCFTREEAAAAVITMMVERAFGDSGLRVVVEEYLEGPEVSVLAFTDGKTMAPMVSSMDHKRARDGDTGPNTGGMGAVAPNPFYTEEVAQRAMREIFLPTMRAMNEEGRPFKGCLFFGLMLTKDGPKVIEYNCRFGDPETQVVLPLLKTDLLTIMRAVEDERLGEVDIEFLDECACCVVLTSGGYPVAYEKGKLIDIGGADLLPGVTVYHSGTALDAQGRYETAGGRVLGVTAAGETLAKAIEKAYDAAGCISFEGAYMRNDIGRRALECGERKGV